MKRLLSKIFLLLFFTNFILSNSQESSPVFPTTVSIAVNGEKNVGEFKIFNTTSEPKTYEILVKEEDNFGEKSELSKYIKVFPRKFTLEPYANKEVRVVIESFPKEMLGKGEYKGAILIKGVTSQVSQKYASKETGKNIVTAIEVKIDISMAIYGLTGNEFEEISIEEKDLSSLKKDGIILKNTGNYSYEIILKYFDKKDNKLFESNPIKIIAGKTQKINLSKEMEEGRIEIIHDKTKKLLLDLKL